MQKSTLYFSLAVGFIGTIVIWQMGKLPLAIGWWCGVAVGVINFSFLLSSLRKSREMSPEQKTGIPKRPFFLRYVGLALVFFLIIQLGQDQFGSALLGFGAYYMVVLVEYMIRMRKGK